MKRHYQQQAMSWNQLSKRPSWGPLSGNGQFGANIWGELQTWNVSIDHKDVWDQREHPTPFDENTLAEVTRAIENHDQKKLDEVNDLFQGHHHGEPLPTNLNAGNLKLKILQNLPEDAQVTEGIDFSCAKAYRRIETESFKLELSSTCLTGSDDTLIEITVEGMDLDIEAELKRTPFDPEHEQRSKYPRPQSLADRPLQFSQSLGEGLEYAMSLVDESGQPLSHPKLKLKAGSSLCLRLRICTVRQHPNPLARLEEVEDLGSALEEHQAWWTQFWSASNISLDDAELECIWRNGMYQLACCSRQGSHPVTLQGLWVPDGSPATWGGGIFSNLNTQISYWPCLGANHPELMEPLVNYLLDPSVRQRMKDQTRELFQCGGICLPVSTNLKGDRLPGWMPVQIWPSAGGWVCIMLWELAQGTNDAKLRQRLHDYFVETTQFLTEFSHRKDPEHPEFFPSHSPEVFDLSPEQLWMKNPTMDLWIYKNMLKICIDSATMLNKNVDQISTWQKHLDRVPPYAVVRKSKWSDGSNDYEHDVTQTQYLCEAEGINPELSHRHLSPCCPIYPGSDPEVLANEQLSKDSVLQNIRRGTGLWIGYSFVWQSCLASRVGLGDMAEFQLRHFWRYFTSSGGLHANGETSRVGLTDFNREYYDNFPLSAETSMAAPAAIQEMLIQSWGEQLQVFPHASRELTGSFQQLRSHQGHLVSASLKDQALKNHGIIELKIEPSQHHSELKLKLLGQELLECSQAYELCEATNTIILSIQNGTPIAIKLKKFWD